MLGPRKWHSLLAILLLLLGESSSSSSSGQDTVDAVPPHDMKSQSQLTDIYNQRVVFAEWLTRPLDVFPISMGVLSHAGVRVTLEDGSKYLIHKGKDFGIQSQTVVVDARHMSNDWKVIKSISEPMETISDYVRAGGNYYNLFFDNCHVAADRMMPCYEQ